MKQLLNIFKHTKIILSAAVFLGLTSVVYAQFCVPPENTGPGTSDQQCLAAENYVRQVNANQTLECQLPKVHTFAVCMSPPISTGSSQYYDTDVTCHCEGNKLASRVRAPCTVGSDTGSCSAIDAVVNTSSLPGSSFFRTVRGSCCVCIH